MMTGTAVYEDLCRAKTDTIVEAILFVANNVTRSYRHCGKRSKRSVVRKVEKLMAPIDYMLSVFPF